MQQLFSHWLPFLTFANINAPQFLKNFPLSSQLLSATATSSSWGFAKQNTAVKQTVWQVIFYPHKEKESMYTCEGSVGRAFKDYGAVLIIVGLALCAWDTCFQITCHCKVEPAPSGCSPITLEHKELPGKHCSEAMQSK